MAVLRICALLLLFDCQEAFHCCLVVACINRINMISIECHRSGERCPGKREFDNRIEINRVRSGEIDVAIPFKVSKIRSIVNNKTFIFACSCRQQNYELRITPIQVEYLSHCIYNLHRLQCMLINGLTCQSFDLQSGRNFLGTNVSGLTRSHCSSFEMLSDTFEKKSVHL